LDIQAYDKPVPGITFRQYALDPFCINVSIADGEEIKKIKYPYGLISKGIRFFRFRILRIHLVSFEPAILKQKGDVYLDGFSQSEKYFSNIAATIRQDFRLKNPLGMRAEKAARDIRSSTRSVSLHVRRGDYVQDAKTREHHGGCTPEYYAEALARITQKVGADIHVFVFSDEIDWVRSNMPIPYPVTYVSSVDIADYEELILMSLCSHNIIANSSFSWWGAWLNSNAEKMVIAPHQWMRNNPHNFRDIIPETWIRL
jgi:hypothetical protein